MSSTTHVPPVYSGNMEEIAIWSGRKFGELRGWRTMEEDIRVLSHTGGFAVFLPKAVWKTLDYQLPLGFPKDPHSSCWIAAKEFAFFKVDVTPKELDEEHKDYAAEDVETAFKKIEDFVRRHFLNYNEMHPKNPEFTHGYERDNPFRIEPKRIGKKLEYLF